MSEFVETLAWMDGGGGSCLGFQPDRCEFGLLDTSFAARPDSTLVSCKFTGFIEPHTIPKGSRPSEQCHCNATAHRFKLTRTFTRLASDVALVNICLTLDFWMAQAPGAALPWQGDASCHAQSDSRPRAKETTAG